MTSLLVLINYPIKTGDYLEWALHMVRTQPSHPEDSSVNFVWDEHKTIERMGGQKALIEKLVALFLRDAPNQIQQALKGIEQHDYDLSHIAAHSLKGTSSNFCTQRLEAICGDLLEALKQRDWQQSMKIHHELSEEYVKLKGQFEEFLKH